jgi:hypothetical protein
VTGRTEHRLGIGGDALPDRGGVPKARWLFLEAVRHSVPEAMQALAVVAPMLPDGPRHTWAHHEAEAPLREWCLRWGFTAAPGSGPDWLLTVARRTAEYLRTKEPAWPDAWVFMWSYRAPAFPEFRSTWNPIEETEAQFRARVDAYIERVRATPGQRPAPRKRAEIGYTVARDFEWTALYQVARLEHEQIAERYRVHESVGSVKRAIEQTAHVIGLALRPPARKRGRPRTKIQTHTRRS